MMVAACLDSSAPITVFHIYIEYCIAAIIFIMSSTLTLRLVLAENLNKKEVITICSSATVKDLYEQAKQCLQEAVAVSDNTSSSSSSSSCTWELWTGIPPRLVTFSTETTLGDAGIQTMQSITVKVCKEVSGNKNKNNNKRNKKEADTKQQQQQQASTTTPSESRPTSKRAAAQKATESFKDAIAYQDNLLAESTAKRQKPSASSSEPPKRPRSFPAASSSVGYRLADGAIVSPRKRKATTGAPKQTHSTYADTADPSAALVEATSGRSKQARLMREGWKQAINDAYEHNKAVARLAAIAANNFTFNLADNERSNSVRITFDKGIQGRGEYTETVDFLTKEVLTTALASIHASGNPEALRPENMALLSPRVLWSLMYHGDTTGDITTSSRSSSPVIIAMQNLQPDLDWSFLKRRKEQLSEKARENLRQQQAKEANANGHSDADEWTRAAEAIAAVEQAMEDMHAFGQTNRLSSITLTDLEPWEVVTPCEPDEEELLACFAASETVFDDYVTQGYISRLQNDLNVHNWRELANQDADILGAALGIDPEVCQSWIDHAQTESVDEIIVEICDGSVDAVELLRERANSGTPSDLGAWRMTVPLLHEVLTVGGSSASQEDAIPSIDDLQKWCNRAFQACDQWNWLNSYATEVDAHYEDET